jgi:hypothetical protein
MPLDDFGKGTLIAMSHKPHEQLAVSRGNSATLPSIPPRRQVDW